MYRHIYIYTYIYIYIYIYDIYIYIYILMDLLIFQNEFVYVLKFVKVMLPWRTRYPLSSVPMKPVLR